MNQCEEILTQIKKAFVGKKDVARKILMTMLAGGHVLLEDIPGVGKTTLAVAFSNATDLQYKRIQFTPDVLPSDITGFSIFHRETGAMEYQPGAAICNLLLADEINRASSRTQSALLEAMEEGSVTVDGVTHLIPQPFTVIATQNPTGSAGTQLLPDSQLDRFMMRLSIGYPEPAAEREMLRRKHGENHGQAVRKVADAAALLTMRDEVSKVFVHEELYDYIVRLARATREHKSIRQGASPRCSVAAMALAQACSCYVMDTRYLSWLLLVMILLLVPLEVLLSLPGLLTLRIKLTAEPLSPTQGGVLTARAEVSSRFPVHCVRLRMQCKNLLTGEEADKKGCFPARGGKMAELPCLWEHCGTVCCQVTNARMVDLLGLFSFRVRLPAPVEVLISPTPTPFHGKASAFAPGGTLEAAARSAGKGGEERSSVREFRDGDQLRDVHWKLSSKLQKLIVREAEQTPQPSVVLAFCLSGAPDRADQVLARLTGLSEELFENQCVHSLQWYDAARGDLHTRQVEDEESFRRVLLEACSSPLSERELRVEDCRKELRAPMVDLLFLIHADGISMFGDAEEGME